MKNIDLKEIILSDVSVNEEGNPEEISAASIIMQAVILMPEGGNFDAMITRISLVKKLKKALTDKEEYLLLETAEHAELIKALKSFLPRMKLVIPALWDYIQKLSSLEDVKVNISENKLDSPKKKRVAAS